MNFSFYNKNYFLDLFILIRVTAHFPSQDYILIFDGTLSTSFEKLFTLWAIVKQCLLLSNNMMFENIS